MIEYRKFRRSINDSNALGTGNFGTVYRFNEDICFKILESNLYNTKVLNLIRTLPLEGIVNIKDFITRDGFIIGYTMDYIKTEDIDLLNIDSSYIIDSYIKLKKDLLLLTKEYIRAIDLYPRNSIISNTGIRLVDLDLYRFDYNPDLLKENLWSLKFFIKNVIGKQIKDDEAYGLFEELINSNNPMDDTFIKRLDKEKNLGSLLRIR